MNNGKIARDSVENVDRTPALGERETKVLKIIEAIRGVVITKEWSSLKELVFEGEIQRLEKELQMESLKEEPNPFKLRFIAGQLERAKRYDLVYLENKYRMELLGMRKLLS